MSFGAILRELLESSNTSYKTLANELNITSAAVGNYIHDAREPDFSTLKKIADYFNVTTDYLLERPAENLNDHSEDHILRIYRSLSDDNKNLLIGQGELLISHQSFSTADKDKK